MKLASALSERADLQRTISELETRLCNNAKVQEDEAPSEDPQVLLKELKRCFARLEELISRINRTNNAVMKDGMTLTDLIAKRDCLKQKVSILRDFLNAASAKADRYSRTEIRLVSTVDVAEMRKELDALSQELRMTDETLQEMNWLTELQ